MYTIKNATILITVPNYNIELKDIFIFYFK